MESLTLKINYNRVTIKHTNINWALCAYANKAKWKEEENIFFYFI